MTASSSLVWSVCGVTATVNVVSVGSSTAPMPGVLGLGLQRLDRVVALGLHGVGRVDLQDEVDAAAQVEPELDAPSSGRP